MNAPGCGTKLTGRVSEPTSYSSSITFHSANPMIPNPEIKVRIEVELVKKSHFLNQLL